MSTFLLSVSPTENVPNFWGQCRIPLNGKVGLEARNNNNTTGRARLSSILALVLDSMCSRQPEKLAHKASPSESTCPKTCSIELVEMRKSHPSTTSGLSSRKSPRSHWKAISQTVSSATVSSIFSRKRKSQCALQRYSVF